MRSRACLCGAICLMVAALGWISRADPGKQADSERVTTLIQQLGAADFARRETARRELEALGEPVLGALRAAQTAGDLEVRRRVKSIIEAITPWSKKSKIIGLEMVRIEAGEFQMGSPFGEVGRRADESRHKVRISKPFYLGVYEVTQGEYHEVMKVNPSWFAASGFGKDRVGAENTGRLPVENVTWFDAVEFCNRLSKQDGYEAYYKLTEATSEKDSIKSARVAMLGGNGYRLPTEAEWEYACRAETTSKFHYGDETKKGFANMKPIMVPSGYGTALKWTDMNRTVRVGSYAPNGWGLFDMHGNAAEWCGDWYDQDYAKSPPLDPQGPESGQHRVVRGGSWLVTEASCRSASRYFLMPQESRYYTGFRIARTP